MICNNFRSVRETGLEPASTYVHMNLNHARLPIPPFPQKMVGRGGFEPPKLIAADLQSAPFGHSGTYPYDIPLDPKGGAGDGTRTRNLLITNQLLCQLSYASLSSDRPATPFSIGFKRPLCRQRYILYTFRGESQGIFLKILNFTRP